MPSAESQSSSIGPRPDGSVPYMCLSPRQELLDQIDNAKLAFLKKC